MGRVFVVFSGEYLLMKVCSKQLEGNLPVFRIEGVFSDENKCKEWIESYSLDKTTKLLSYLEIPINPQFGQKESEMEVFNVRMNADLQILEISMGDSGAIPDDKLFTYKVLKNGEIVGSFWARDFIDACKLAYIRVQETLYGKNQEQDCIP